MARILIAEEEKAVNDLMAANLRLVGHDCTQALHGEQARALLQQNRYDLVLLDVALPGVDGFALKEELPPEQPVIFVTARTVPQEKLHGLHLGAEDYMVKPFELLELLARVDTALRRSWKGGDDFTFRDLRVDFNAHRVWRAGREVELTPREFALLETLVLNRNLAMSRDRLLQIAWGYDYVGASRTVDVHINRLRRKLGLEQHIQTVFKVGYRLNTRG